jgi:hypothetical protein
LLATDDTDVPEGEFSEALTSSDISRKGSTLMSVPKEVWRLVDVLYHRGLDTRGLFLVPGDPADCLETRECLDTGDAIPARIDVLSVAQTLLDLLSSLREPVVPCALFPRADFKSIPLDAWCSHLLKQLSPLHYNVFVYVVRFGREVLAHGHANGVQVDDLAFVLSRCVMRRIPHDDAAAHASMAGSDAATAAAVAAGGSGGGGSSSTTPNAAPGGGDEAAEGSVAVGSLSLYADKGTRWEPTREEQDAMTRILAYFLAGGPLV